MRNESKPNVATFALGLITIVCSVLALILSSTLLRDWIIIGFGVRMLSRVQSITGILTGVGIATTIIGVVPILKAAKRRREMQDQERRSNHDRSQVLANYAQDSSNPDFTRKRLEQLRTEVPGLEILVAECLQQMDMMDMLQEKQKALIETNDARYLKNTISVFNNVERGLCRNFRSIINLCIATESADCLNDKKLRGSLENNNKMLDNTKELLRASAEWINQYNAGESNDLSEVESWIAVIHDSLEEG